MSGQPRPESGGFNPYIHGARGLFAGMVFVFHVSNSGLPTFVFPGSEALQFFLQSFKFGVELFFGISGVVIMGALSRAPSLLAFAWDRFTRIYPVLWATLVVLIGLAVLMHRPLPSHEHMALNFLIPPPGMVIPLINPPSWSLTFELSFYLLCGIGWSLRRWRPAKPVFVAIGLGLNLLFPRTLLMLPGVLIGTGRLTDRAFPGVARFPLVTLVAFLLLWQWLDVLMGGNTGRLTPAIIPLVEWLPLAPSILLAGLLGTITLTSISAGRGMLGRLLATPFLQWMGTISYSFYLWHPTALEAAKQLLTRTHVLEWSGQFTQLLIFCAGLPIALAVSAVSQIVIEKQLTRFLRRIGPGPHRKPVVTTAEAAGEVEMRDPAHFKHEPVA